MRLSTLSTLSTRRRASVAILAAAGALACAAVPVAAASRAHSAATPGCSTSNLVVWMNTNGNGAAGSIVYTLEFTNLGPKCTLNGFPGVSAVSLHGHQLGKAASRNKAFKPHSVTIGSGKTAIALLKVTQAVNFPAASCHEVTAAGLKVFPPNARRSKTIPFPFPACSSSGPVFLNVRPVQKA
jgi:hypothetical protein